MLKSSNPPYESMSSMIHVISHTDPVVPKLQKSGTQMIPFSEDLPHVSWSYRCNIDTLYKPNISAKM